MPRLLRGVARTAVVAGTATAVSNRVSRRQANRWAADNPQPEPTYQEAPPQAAPVYQAPPPPAPPAESSVDRMAALQQLAQLKEQGILTELEFEQEKARILAS
jgi:hypothetical protein